MDWFLYDKDLRQEGVQFFLMKNITEIMINSKMHFILIVVSPFSAFQEHHFNEKSEINDLNVNLPSQKYLLTQENIQK